MNYTFIRSCILLFILFQLNASLFSQRIIRGTISNSESEPLEGASVLVKGTTVGMFTNSDGMYALEIPAEIKNPVLMVSYVGYEKAEISLEAGQESGSIALEAADIILEEFYICCNCPPAIWQNIGERKYLGSTNYQHLIATSPEQLLFGEMNFLQSCSRPLSQPLYVLNGVPLPPMTSASFGGNPLSFISPQEIKDIYISTPSLGMAKYGSQAINGLVSIKTHKRNSYNTHLKYEGGIGISQNLQQAGKKKAIQQHNLAYSRDKENSRIYSNVFFRDFSGFEAPDRLRNFGGSLSLTNSELQRGNLTVSGQFAFSKMIEKVAPSDQAIRKNVAKTLLQTHAYDNYFSSLHADYSLPENIDLSILANKFQHASPLTENTQGTFVESKITYRTSIKRKHGFDMALRHQYRDFSQHSSPDLKQNSLNVELEYESRKKFNAQLNLRQEQSLLSQFENPANSFYASLGLGKEISFRDKNKCARSRLELITQIGLARTPFLHTQNLNLGTEFYFSSTSKIQAAYCFTRIDEIDNSFISSPSVYLLFPTIYDQLESKGMNISIESSHRLFYGPRIIFDAGYNRGNGLSKERYKLNTRLAWQALDFTWRIEGIRGWRYSGTDQTLFRLADAQVSYYLDTQGIKWIKNLRLSFSSQNLLMKGEQQVLFDQIEIARTRNPSLFPIPLAKNLLLGIKMNLP